MGVLRHPLVSLSGAFAHRLPEPRILPRAGLDGSRIIICDALSEYGQSGILDLAHWGLCFHSRPFPRARVETRAAGRPGTSRRTAMKALLIATAPGTASALFRPGRGQFGRKDLANGQQTRQRPPSPTRTRQTGPLRHRTRRTRPAPEPVSRPMQELTQAEPAADTAEPAADTAEPAARHRGTCRRQPRNLPPTRRCRPIRRPSRSRAGQDHRRTAGGRRRHLFRCLVRGRL